MENNKKQRLTQLTVITQEELFYEEQEYKERQKQRQGWKRKRNNKPASLFDTKGYED
jgi:hypothetical protein